MLRLSLALPLLLAVGTAAEAAQVTYEFSIDSLSDTSSAGAGLFDGGSAAGTLTIDHATAPSLVVGPSPPPVVGPGAPPAPPADAVLSAVFPDALVAFDITLTSTSSDTTFVTSTALGVIQTSNFPESAVLGRILVGPDLGNDILEIVTFGLSNASPGVFPAETIPVLDLSMFPSTAGLLIGDFTGGLTGRDRIVSGDFTKFAAVPATMVPEPGAALLFSMGGLITALAIRRRA